MFILNQRKKEVVNTHDALTMVEIKVDTEVVEIKAVTKVVAEKVVVVEELQGENNEK